MRSPLFKSCADLVNDFLFWQERVLLAPPAGNTLEARNQARRAFRGLQDVREDLERLPISDEVLQRRLARALRDLVVECEELTALVADLANQAALEPENTGLGAACQEWQAVRMPNIRRCMGCLFDLEQELDRLPEPAPATAANGAGSTGVIRAKDQKDRQILERLALAELLVEGPNAKRIAEKVGVKRSTLLGWPIFRERYNRMKAEQKKDTEERRRRLRRGDEDEDE
jgi:hypothetical protein